MPGKGQGWTWSHVCVDGQDVQIIATCNGTSAAAFYYSQAQGGGTPCGRDPAGPDYNYPYAFPLGITNESNFTGGCTEAAVKAWASDPATFANRH
jgi:hypothetical protein